MITDESKVNKEGWTIGAKEGSIHVIRKTGVKDSAPSWRPSRTTE